MPGDQCIERYIYIFHNLLEVVFKFLSKLCRFYDFNILCEPPIS